MFFRCLRLRLRRVRRPPTAAFATGATAALFALTAFATAALFALTALATAFGLFVLTAFTTAALFAFTASTTAALLALTTFATWATFLFAGLELNHDAGENQEETLLFDEFKAFAFALISTYWAAIRTAAADVRI